MIDDLFEEVKNDDYENIMVSFVFFVIEVSYLTFVEFRTQSFKLENVGTRKDDCREAN